MILKLLIRVINLFLCFFVFFFSESKFFNECLFVKKSIFYELLFYIEGNLEVR